VAENTNTYWEWYNRIDKFGSNIVTISAKGVKVWNNNLEVIESYNNLANEKAPYNLRATNDRFILNVDGGHLNIFDRENQNATTSIALNFKVQPNNHQTYQDQDYNVYVVDDYYAKKYAPSGKLLESFGHLDYEGFDITGSGNSYVYFSNGMGVVKLQSEDMALKDFAYTTNSGERGGWAMGLKVVSLNGSDRVVVFNNTSILVLDENLNKIASMGAVENETNAYPTENLYLNLDYGSGTKNATVKLNGGGFLPREKLKINFAGSTTELISDAHGRFATALLVPDKKGTVDIKVDGQDSKLTYSISFNVVKN
jgi:hypothetical protein